MDELIYIYIFYLQVYYEVLYLHDKLNYYEDNYQH